MESSSKGTGLERKKDSITTIKEFILNERWNDIRGVAMWSKECSKPPYRKDIITGESPEQHKKRQEWNRMHFLELTSGALTIAPEKKGEFNADDIWKEILNDVKEYHKAGGIKNYAKMLYFIKQIWPEKFLEMGSDEEMKERIKEKVKEEKTLNWRMWPNIFIEAKSLCPEVLKELDQLKVEEYVGELRNVMEVNYGHNWENYFAAFANLKIVFPEAAANIVLDETAKKGIEDAIVSGKTVDYKCAAMATVALKN